MVEVDDGGLESQAARIAPDCKYDRGDHDDDNDDHDDDNDDHGDDDQPYL